MKKLYITLAILLAAIVGAGTTVLAHNETKEIQETSQLEEETSVVEIPAIDILATMNQSSESPNRIWVGTFQIVWNEFMDNIVYGPVRFVGENPKMLKELNKQEFKKTDISENAYYTKYGIISPELKTEIEQGIKDKFNEKSDILDSFDWTKQPDKIFIYAMLKKDFQFLHAFDRLSEAPFGQNLVPIKYFGINNSSSKKLYKNVKVLFYNSSGDFAVKLSTKDKDEVLLYRTDEDTTFDKYFTEIKKKTSKYHGSSKFEKKDELMIPEISLYKETSFPDVEGRDVKRTNYKIDKTIETVDFRMNNEGVKLKSEAAMTVRMTSLMPEEHGREFYYNDNFILFLIEKGQNKPYYAMRVNDAETLNKTGRADK